MDDHYEALLREYLGGEFKVFNAQLPSKPKTLSALLREDHPGILCNDGNIYLIKKKELEYLAGILNADEQSLFLLPLLIEIIPGQDEMAVVSRGNLEEKVIAEILGMPVTTHKGRIKIYRPQLALIRKVLRTATQYIFSPRLPGESASSR
jgi:uncharacterized protein